MNDALANDRTYLAWLRTGIALMGLGFIVAKAALILRPDRKPLPYKNLYSAGGILIVACGAALIVVGYLQHAALARTLQRDHDLDPSITTPRWPIVITAGAMVISVLLSTLIAIST